MKTVQWGVLGVSGFAMRKWIPGVRKSATGRVAAIASRDGAKARDAAEKMGIDRSYSSYEELLADPAVDAVYVPLPNHLHVAWSIRAAQAGKHVLCEKPIALNQGEIRELMAARDQAGVVVGEAFMVATHPQWVRVRERVREGDIGELRAVHGVFSYCNEDPENIRNQAAMGGGALLDIGCYPIFTTRFVTGAEPRRVASVIDRDPRFGTDRLTSAILDFPGFQAAFTVSMQMAPAQWMTFFGTRGRLELEIPFNALPDKPARVIFDDGSDLTGGGRKVEEMDICDQYAVQADAFAAAIAGEREVPVALEDSLRNMAVMEAVFRSEASGMWESVRG